MLIIPQNNSDHYWRD